MAKVIVLGLDGATFDIIKPLAESGKLPALSHMMESGAWGELGSTTPPVTPAAWTSFFTGKNPGKHGIFDFARLDPRTYEQQRIRADQHREKTIWQLLGDAGKRSIILDVPFTYPPRPLNGWMITGYGTPRTPGTPFTYPPNLADLVPADLRPEIRIALPPNRFDRSQAFIDEWQTVMDGRRRLVRHLMRDQDWDFFLLVFSITDHMAHVFWTFADPGHPNYYTHEAENYRRAFLAAYQTCDRLLGDIMSWAASETTTLVISDHGFGSVRPRQYLMEQLTRAGYFQSLPSAGSHFLGDRLLRLVLRQYNKFPWLREWVKGLRPGQRRAVGRTLRRVNLMPSAANVDTRRSQVLPSAPGFALTINHQGRFAEGPVTSDDYEELMESLTSFLLSRRDPIDGRPIFSAVHRGRDVYHGPHADDAPDLLLQHANFFSRTGRPPKLNPHLEGGHVHSGIFLATGAGIAQATVKRATLIDVAPTILHLSGLEIPPDMDGRVLNEIYTDGFSRTHPIIVGDKPAQMDGVVDSPDFTAEEAAEVDRQLRQLGYL